MELLQSCTKLSICSIQNYTRPSQFFTRPVQNALALASGQVLVSLTAVALDGASSHSRTIMFAALYPPPPLFRPALLSIIPPLSMPMPCLLPFLPPHAVYVGPRWACKHNTVSVNPLHAKFFRGNKNFYSHFMSILYIDMTHIIGILPRERPRLAYFT